VYVIIKDDKIQEIFSKEVSMNSIRGKYPQERVVQVGDMFSPGHAKNFLRVHNKNVVNKIIPQIIVSKKHMLANSQDEVEVKVKLFDLQKGEKIKEVTLDIKDAKIPVKLSDGEGSIIFSTEAPGIYLIKIEATDDMLYASTGVMAE
jgi:hypothetical protein